MSNNIPWREILNHLPIGVSIARADDPDLALIYVNNCFESVTSFSANEVLGKNCRILQGPERNPAIAKQIRAALENQETFGGELKNVRKDGQVWWNRLQITPMFNGEGEVKYYLGVQQDVTQFREATSQLEQSEALYRGIFESTSDGILLVEAEGPNAGKIFSANQAAAELHLCEIEDLIGMSIRDIDSPEDALLIDDRIKDTIAKGSNRWDVKHKRKDGTLIDLECTATALRRDGNAFFLAIYRDISERIRAEQRRRRSEEELRERQRRESLGDMARGVGHDFNNLLTSIQGSAELGLLEANGKTQEYFDEIMKSARKAATLCHQLMTYAGKQKGVMSEVDLNAAIRSIASLLEVSTPRGVALKLDLAAEAPHINGSEQQLTQLVLNLVQNAAEAITPERGKITISTKLQANDPPQSVVLSVQDDGRGMNDQERARIFDPFFSTKDSSRGLGLAVVHGIVQNHHGKLTVESKEGEGSTVSVTFPLLEPLHENESPAANGGGVVFVASRDARIQRMLDTFLFNMGRRTETFESIEQLVSASRNRSEPPMVIIVDIGEQIQETFNKLTEEFGVDLPLIFLGNVENTQIAGARKSVEYLTKPFRMASLQKAISRLL